MVVSIGLDVSKAKLDVAVLQDDNPVYQHVENNLNGWQKLHHWLQEARIETGHLCMEATGIYGQGVAQYFHTLGYIVSVVNPARTHAFGASLLQRNKTDKWDAYTIALFCQRMQPDAWQPPAETANRMQVLARLAADLESDHTRCLNRAENLTQESPAWRYIQQQIVLLECQQREVEQEIQSLIQASSDLKEQHKLLTSIVGIGDKTAAALLGELPDLSQFDSARQLVAYAGLSPQRYESGSSVHRRTKLSKIGAARLRQLLYFPALTAIRHNPHLASFAERLKAAGKEKMVVVGAVMRKLLVLVYAILKSGQPYDRNYGFTS
jgi:transposase